MDDKYGRSVRTRRRALDLSQMQLALAVGRSQGWVARLENLQLPVTETDKRRIEAVLRTCQRAQVSAANVAHWSKAKRAAAR